MNECGCSEGGGCGWTGWCSGHLAILVVPKGLDRAGRGRWCQVWNSVVTSPILSLLIDPVRSPAPYSGAWEVSCLHLYLCFSTHLLLTVGSSDSLLPSWLVPPLCQGPLDWWFWAWMLVLLLALLPSFSLQIPTYLHIPSYGPALPQSEPSSSF